MEKFFPPTEQEKAQAQVDAKAFAEKREGAEGALKLIEANQQARTLVDQGIISGFGAETRLSAAKAMNLATGDKEQAAILLGVSLATLYRKLSGEDREG